jgi:4-amino-4-deoxy-L-arabinose transferase-like glycosyltransferase
VTTAGREKRQVLVAVALLTVLAGALRFTNLGLQSLWIDEALTTSVLDPSLADTFDTLVDREATPPLYYAVAWIWTQVLGEGDVALRSLSALLGTATVPAAYLAGARLASRRAGVIAAALVATSPYLIWYSQEARSYALAMLLAALSLAFLAAAARPAAPRRRELVLWAVACSLLLATHYFSVVLIAAEGLWLLRERGRDREVVGALAAPAATGLVLAPLAVAQEHADWIANLGFDSRLNDTARFFVGGYGGAPGTGLGLTAGLLAAAGIVLLFVRARDEDRRGGLLALGIAGAALVASLVLVLGGLDYVYHRNLLVIWIPLAIAVGAGFAAARTAGLAAATLLCAVFLTSHIVIVNDDERHRTDWQSAVERLGRSDEPRPVAVWPPYADPELVHYGMPVIDQPDARVQARELVVMGEGLANDRLTPGRRVGAFTVAGRWIDHGVTSAVLRAEKLQEVKLGLILHTETLGAPDLHFYLDPGRTAD